jgi:hypothetical protein
MVTRIDGDSVTRMDGDTVARIDGDTVTRIDGDAVTWIDCVGGGVSPSTVLAANRCAGRARMRLLPPGRPLMGKLWRIY